MSGTTGNKRSALKVRKDDLYQTDGPAAVPALLKHEEAFGQPVPSVLWEPCCGPGEIVKVLRDTGRQVYATDLIDYRGPPHHSTLQDVGGWDFLMETQAPLGVQGIITNPPFKLAALMVDKALTLVPRVYMLLRLAFLEAGTDSSEAGRARLRVLDGGKLARVLVFRNRLPMMHREDYEGPKAGSQMPMAWFVWDQKFSGDAIIRRITWEPGNDRRGDASQPRGRKRAAGRDPESQRGLL